MGAHGIISVIPDAKRRNNCAKSSGRRRAAHCAPGRISWLGRPAPESTMTIGIAYVKTLKGIAEAAAKAGKLSAGLKTLLGMIDQSTVADLHHKLPQVPLEKLNAALDRLFVEGYIEIATEVPAATAPAATEEELDFTRFINRPVKEPTIQQKRQAETTLAGIKAPRKAGFHVNIFNRPAKRIAPHARGDKYTVLIIDADDANSLVVARALLLAKFDTRAAAKQDEIIAQLNKQPPVDVIAMDVVLPDVIGLELLARLRDHPTYKSVPIIVMTAKVDHDDLVAALAYGASGYMTKPFKPEALVESVNAVLGL
jgi:CheY-like chemotaxis protein